MCWDQQIDGTILSLSIKGCLTQQTLFEKLATVFNFLLYMRYGVQLSNKVIHIENKYTRDGTLNKDNYNYGHIPTPSDSAKPQ